MNKKILSLLIVIAMVITLVPSAVLAEEGGALPALIEQPSASASTQPGASASTQPGVQPLQAPKAAAVLAQSVGVYSPLATGTGANIDTGDITITFDAVNNVFKISVGSGQPFAMDPADALQIIQSNLSVSNTITVDTNTTVPLDIEIQSLNIAASGKSALDIKSGKVNLTLVGDSKLALNRGSKAGSIVHVATAASLTIDGEGRLEIDDYNPTSAVSYATGIGGNNSEACGTGIGGADGAPGTLKNAGGADVYLTTVTLDSADGEEINGIGNLSSAITYGTKDMKTVDTDKLYVYLTKDSEVQKVLTPGDKKFWLCKDKMKNCEGQT